MFFWLFQVQSATASSLGEGRDKGLTCLVEGKGRVMNLDVLYFTKKTSGDYFWWIGCTHPASLYGEETRKKKNIHDPLAYIINPSVFFHSGALPKFRFNSLAGNTISVKQFFSLLRCCCRHYFPRHPWEVQNR